MLTVSDTPINAAAELEAFQALHPEAGGIVSFSGMVRPNAASGKVTGLHLQAYSPMTENGIEQTCRTAMERWSLTGARVAHRTGDMQPGDTIVFVATASKHRRQAFEAADFLMDYLKTQAVFWKKETCADGENWIEPRAEDYKDNARWAEQENDPCQA